MTSTPAPDTSLAAAVSEGLAHAAHLVGRFGWHPPGPDDSHLNIGTTLNLAACKTAPLHGQPVHDVQAVMAHRLSRHLGCGLVEWEDSDGLNVARVVEALRDASRKAPA
jgi:hypothetical protein